MNLAYASVKNLSPFLTGHHEELSLLNPHLAISLDATLVLDVAPLTDQELYPHVWFAPLLLKSSFVFSVALVAESTFSYCYIWADVNMVTVIL